MKTTCHVTPYEGSDAYLFFSYCHEDAGIAYPLMERLARAGVRIWYDSGIVAGSEWPEAIASHLEHCHACLLLISDAAAASHNCRNEMNYAVQANKALIPVNYRDVKLTLGMKLMIGSTQWITLSELPKEEEIARILGSEAIKPCQGIQDHRIVAQPFNIHGVEEPSAPVVHFEKPIVYVPEKTDEQKKMIPEQDEKKTPAAVQPKDEESEARRQEQQKEMQPTIQASVSGADEGIRNPSVSLNPPAVSRAVNPGVTVAEEEKKEKKLPIENKSSTKPYESETDDSGKDIRSDAAEQDHPGRRSRRRRGNTPVIPDEPVYFQPDPQSKEQNGVLPLDESLTTDENELTVLDTDGGYDDDEFEATIKEVDVPPTIVRVSNGAKYRGQNGETTIGRGKKCEVQIVDPARKISNAHVRLNAFDSIFMVTDLDSTNGTWINGVPLGKGEQTRVEDLVELRLSSEYLLVAFGDRARELWYAPCILCLRSEETGEAKYVYNGKLELGRSYPWKSGAMKAKNIGHMHATIEVSEDGASIQDHSKNGTFLNNERIESGQPVELVTGDRIRLGDEHFVVVLIQSEKGEAI